MGLEAIARRSSRDAAFRLQRAMHETVAEVGDVVRREQINCHWAHGGTVSIARNTVQMDRLRQHIAIRLSRRALKFVIAILAAAVVASLTIDLGPSVRALGERAASDRPSGRPSPLASLRRVLYNVLALAAGEC